MPDRVPSPEPVGEAEPPAGADEGLPSPAELSPAEALAVDCLKAPLYGLRAVPALLWLCAGWAFYVSLPVVFVILCSATLAWNLHGAWAIGFVVLAEVALLVLVLVFAGHFLEFFRDVVVGSVENSDLVPEMPPLRPRDQLPEALRALGAIFVYVLPVVTLPLLPLGVLGLAWADGGGGLDLVWALKAARRRPRQLAVLWAVLLPWAAAVVAGPWLTLTFFFWISGDVIRQLHGHWVGQFLSMVFVGEGVVLAVAVALLSPTVCCRCIGLFGRRNPAVLEMLPHRDNRLRAAAFIAAGGAVFVLALLTVAVVASRLM